MTQDDIIRMAREAGLTESNHHSKILVRHSNGSWVDVEQVLTRFSALVAAAEREACIAAIQAQIDHAHINELRLTPRFGRRHGEIAVRADDLEATLDGIRARGKA